MLQQSVAFGEPNFLSYNLDKDFIEILALHLIISTVVLLTHAWPGTSVPIPLGEKTFERIFLEHKSRLRFFVELILHPGSSVACLNRSNTVVPRRILIVHVLEMMTFVIKPIRI
jgi:hypothetical protein